MLEGSSTLVYTPGILLLLINLKVVSNLDFLRMGGLSLASYFKYKNEK